MLRNIFGELEKEIRTELNFVYADPFMSPTCTSQNLMLVLQLMGDIQGAFIKDLKKLKKNGVSSIDIDVLIKSLQQWKLCPVCGKSYQKMGAVYEERWITCEKCEGYGTITTEKRSTI